MGDSKPTFERRVFRMLARLSVGAVPRDPLIGELQRARARHQREELAAARSGSSDDRELLDEFAEENADLTVRVDELEKERDDLRKEAAGHRRAWAAMPSSPADEELPPEEEPPEDPASWTEFSQRLPELLSDAFVLTRRASEQCASNPYPDPTRMWEQLGRLSEAAEDYRSQDARVGKRLPDWLSERHELDVRPFDRRLGGQTFDYEGVTYDYSRMPHVAVDDYKDPSRCGRIYFATDETHARFIVDHVGPHL